MRQNLQYILAPMLNWRFLLVACSFVGFLSLAVNAVGIPAIIMSLIPAYWFASRYGRWGGVVIASLWVPFHLTLFGLVGGLEMLQQIRAPFWVTAFALPFMLYEVGYSRELSRKLAAELDRSKQLAEALRQERDRAEQANQAKDAVLMSISHDLRTPVSAMIQSAQLIEVDAAEATVQTGLIQRTGRQLLSVINDLLRGYGQEQKQILRPAPFDLHALLQEIISQHNPLFASRGLRCELDWASDLPDWLQGQRQTLYRILANLLSNALKHTEGGGVALSARRTDGDQLELVVSDTGPGIPAHRLAELLGSANLQPQANQKGDQLNFGMGLANCLRLSEEMGARLDLRPNRPQGLRAILTMPLREARAPAVAKTAAVKADPELAANELNVLVIDDEATSAETLLGLFRQLGCAASWLPDGVTGMRHVMDQPVELAFVDFQLPDTDGINLARQIREQQPDATIVLFSANILLTDLEQWLDEAVDLILSKPITLAELSEVRRLAAGDASVDEAKHEPGEALDLSCLSERQRELLRQYLDQALFAYGRQDYPACAAQAHKLASAAKTLTLALLGDTAQRVEDLANAEQRIALFGELRALARLLAGVASAA